MACRFGRAMEESVRFCPFGISGPAGKNLDREGLWGHRCPRQENQEGD